MQTWVITWWNCTPYRWRHVAAVGLKRFSLDSCHACKNSRFPLLLLFRFVIEMWVSLASVAEALQWQFPPACLYSRWKIHLQSQVLTRSNTILPYAIRVAWLLFLRSAHFNSKLRVLKKVLSSFSVISVLSVFYIPSLSFSGHSCAVTHTWLCY